MLEQIFFHGACDLLGDPGWSSPCLKNFSLWKSGLLAADCEELLPVEWTYVEEFHGELSPGKDRISSKYPQLGIFSSKILHYIMT